MIQIVIALLAILAVGTAGILFFGKMSFVPFNHYRKLLAENESLWEENRSLARRAREANRVIDLTNSITSLLANMPAMTFSKDVEDGHYLVCNQMFAEYAGKEAPSQVVGLTDAELFDKRRADMFEGSDRIALSMDEPYVFNETTRDISGGFRFFQTTKLKFTDTKGRLCLLGMSIDVSELAMVKQENARANEAYRKVKDDITIYSRIAALSGQFICIYMVDPQTDHFMAFTIDDMNDSLPLPQEGEDFFASTQRETEILIHREDRDRILGLLTKENVMSQIEKTGVFSTEYRLIINDEARYVNFRATLKKEETGTSLIVGVLDVDAQVRHEMEVARDLEMLEAEGDRLLDMSERAMAANEAKSAFLSNMSHEIRTPINAVLGLNEMILRECDDQNILNYSESIRTASNTLLGIVNDILDFSKIEAGKMEIIPVDYDISSVLNDLVNMIQIRADDKGLVLALDFDEGIPNLLNGDEIRIKQVITNLLTNAVKYTEKGRIVFSISYERIPEEEDSVILCVSVKDTGIGIKSEDIDKLFSEFQRIEEERNRNIEGTGLGMNITQRLLEMMGSSLQVESEYGVGSTFSFTLKQKVLSWEPLGDYEAAYKKHLQMRGRYKEKFRAPEAQVLVVDDNQMNLMVFTSLLKHTGVSIETAESGDEALSLMYDKKYDIIYLDHMMPEKDGIETLHEMRGQEKNPNLNTPVICLTANAISGAREQYIAEGFDDYLTKPIDSLKLEEMTMHYLPQEKVELPSEDWEEGERSPEEEMLPSQLAPLEGEDWIDLDAGIKNSGSVEAFMPLLKLFYVHMQEKADEIQTFYDREDWENYTIKVHALKSSARIIGAEAFGEEAQALEDAGKALDTDYIHSHHEAFMERLFSFAPPLAKVFEESSDQDKPEADEVLMQTVFDEIRIAAEEIDLDVLDSIFAEMSAYRIPKAHQKRWEEILDAAAKYDYDLILGTVK